MITKKTNTLILSDVELNTVLAALASYCESDDSDRFSEIATDLGKREALTKTEVSALMEKVNGESPSFLDVMAAYSGSDPSLVDYENRVDEYCGDNMVPVYPVAVSLHGGVYVASFTHVPDEEGEGDGE